MAGDEKPKEKLLSAKLMVDTSSNRVIFAEAGKDVVDFLFGLLQMPLASLIRAAAPGCFPGSTPNVYESLNTLDSSFINPKQTKESLLNPHTASPAAAWLLGPNETPAATHVKYFTCPFDTNGYNTHKNNNSNGRFISSSYGNFCPYCRSNMTIEIPQVGPKLVDSNGGEGYVKELVTYMVMDDLRITPTSSINGMLLLNEMQVRDVVLLEKKEVNIGISEGLELLKASLQSKTVLTDVFLKKENEEKEKQKKIKEEKKEEEEKKKVVVSKKTRKRVIRGSVES